MTTTRPQDLNVPVLTLAAERGAVRAAELQRVLAFQAGLFRLDTGVPDPTDVWRFSAIVNLATQRLLRYGLLRTFGADALAITPRGQLFLARGFKRLDPRTRQSLDRRGRGLPESA